ncbi:MAG: hypothetical protein PHX61_15035, partial [Alphaproteobacteria bacterium]|nr:hypothetical protein [Alphaproteobacteria bacterium]
MIIQALLDLIKAFILFVIGLFPTLPEAQFDSLFAHLAPVADVINTADMFIDISVCVACVGIIFLVYNARAIWSLIMWV